MEIRYSASPDDVKRYTSEELRREFLITDLYQPDAVKAVYSHMDRMVVLGILPVREVLSVDKGIDVWASFGTKYFLERREAGVFNLGGPGFVKADRAYFELSFEDCLYVSMGTRTLTFGSFDPEKPARFYLVSAPAHRACRTTFLSLTDAARRPCGDAAGANRRVIHQFIHPDVLDTCQLSMGLTQLDEGSVWNTMPAHTHERRMEIYTYFNIPDGNAVFHLMGQPRETRHLLVRNFEAVLSPSWSIHAGVGTAAYTFLWAMGGENRAFDDMDEIAVTDLR